MRNDVSKWKTEGVKFECQGSGNCCLSRGEYGFVFLTRDDRKRMSESLKMSLRDFTRKYCDKTQGFYHLKESPERPECLFLEGKRCGIYQARPTQCRTWPFWPEVMNAKTWNKEVKGFCPGVGKGRVWSPEEIKKLLAEQKHSESSLLKERAPSQNK
jgi:Fe-S-cluster containining protein